MSLPCPNVTFDTFDSSHNWRIINDYFRHISQQNYQFGLILVKSHTKLVKKELSQFFTSEIIWDKKNLVTMSPTNQRWDFKIFLNMIDRHQFISRSVTRELINQFRFWTVRNNKNFTLSLNSCQLNSVQQRTGVSELNNNNNNSSSNNVLIIKQQCNNNSQQWTTSNNNFSNKGTLIFNLKHLL